MLPNDGSRATGHGWQTVLWLSWLAFAVSLTWPLYRTVLEAFRNPGPEFYRLVVWLMATFPIVMAAYLWIRRGRWWRYEPVALVGFCGALLLVYRPWATVLLIVLFLDCYALGVWLLRRAGLSPRTGEIPVASALGMGMLGPALFLLGIGHLYYWWIFAAGLMLPCVLLRRHWLGLGGAFRQLLWTRWQQADELRGPLAGVAVVFIAMAAVSSCLAMLAPSVVFDAIHMHLREAFYYAGTHALTPLPGLEYSYYPGAFEALMTVMVSLGGQAAAQLPAALFSGLTILLAVRLARQAGHAPDATLAGIAALVTMPVYHWTASAAKNDVMMALFELAALQCFLYWQKDGNFRWILSGSFLLASAFDVKHVALFGGIPLLALFLYAAWRQPARWPAMARIVLILVLAGTYWHGRTFLLKGDPVYPESVSKAAPGAVAEAAAPARWLLGQAARFGSTIWRLQFDGQFAFEGPLRAPAGIVLLVFLPVWVLYRRRGWSRAATVLVLFSGVYLLYWMHTYPVLRYALAALILLFVLTGARLGEWFQQAGLPVRVSLAAALAYCLLFGILSSAVIGLNGPQLRWLAGRVDDRGYLREASATYRVSEFLGGAARRGDRVLGVDFFPSIYAPPGIRVDGYAMGWRQKPTEEFAGAARQGGFQWIVTTRGVAGEVREMMERAGAGGLHLRSRYEDPVFVVFQVERGL